MNDAITKSTAPRTRGGMNADTRCARLARGWRRSGAVLIQLLLLGLLMSAGSAFAAPVIGTASAPLDPDGGIIPLVFESRAPSDTSGGGLSIISNFVHAHTFRLTEPTRITSIGAYIEAYQVMSVYAALYRIDTPDSWFDAVDESNLLGTTLLYTGYVPGVPGDSSGELSIVLQPGWYAIGVGTGRHGASAGPDAASLVNTGTPTTPNSRGPYSVNTSTNGIVLQGASVRFFVRGETLTAPPPAPTDFLMESARNWAWLDFVSSPVDDDSYYATRFEVEETARVDRVSAWMRAGSGQVFAAIVRLPSAAALPLPLNHPGFADSLVGTTLIDIGNPSRDYAGDFGGLELTPGHYALLFGSGRYGATGSGYLMEVANGIVIPGSIVWGGSFWGDLGSAHTYRMSLSGIVPELSITPDPITFEPGPVGVTQERTVTISNLGAHDLHVSGISIINIGVGAFSLGSGGETCFPAIEPGGQCSFTVLFTGPSVGTFTSGIRVTSDRVPDPYDVVLVGTAVPARTVTPQAGPGGSIDPSTAQIVGEGATTSFVLSAEAHHHVDDVGGSCGGTLAGNIYTTAPVSADCSVVANFAIDTFTVTPSADAHGSITPATAQSVDYGAITSFTLAADSGYHVETVTGSCGGTLAGNLYSTVPVSADCSVVASFAIDPADTIIMVSGSAQSTTVTTPFDAPLVVRAINAAGLAVADVSVTFSAPTNGASASVSTSAVTDAFGEASVLAQANAIAGVYTIEASIDGVAVPATFELSNLAAAADRIIALVGSKQAAKVGTGFPLGLVARVTDAHDNPVAGSTVSFAVPDDGASASLSASTATTDAQGHVSVSATANDVVGSYFVEASVAGLEAARFALENLAPDLGFGVRIDDGLDHAAYGQDLEYVVTLSNTGSDAANGVGVLAELPEQLDASLAIWTCIDPASGCALEGAGDLVDSGLLIPASGSVTYLISVPVRSDAPGDDILINATAIADHAGPVSDADLDLLVVFRDGFDTDAEDRPATEAPAADRDD